MGWIGGALDLTFGQGSYAKRYNDRVTNWGDTKDFYNQGLEGIDAKEAQALDQLSNSLRSVVGDQNYKDTMNTLWQDQQKQLNRSLANRGLLGGGQAVTAQSDAYRRLNTDLMNRALDRNASAYMNYGNQVAGLLGNNARAQSDMYGQLGQLRYQNSPGKHFLSLWGAN